MTKTILVTGGNRGIGLATVKALAEEFHFHVIMGVRDLDSGKSAANTIQGKVDAVALDLSNPVLLQEQLQTLLCNYPEIHGLINNGAVLNEGSALEIAPEKWQEALQVNVLAPYTLIKALVPMMIRQNYGRIVNLSSGWGSFHEGLTGPFSYSFSKASLNALTLTMSKDLPASVKINSMCPGWVKTRMGGEAAPRSPREGADTALWLVTLPENGPTGGFFRDRKKINW
jgi:NAD(P)-dependent dehydrogenase (short-subunit alcohol dehydrogenase family)